MPANSTRPNLIDEFNRYFELVLAQSEDEKKEVFKLRYQVYCVETGFEKEGNCHFEHDGLGNKIGLEIDEYDSRSTHFLVKHIKSGLYAATVRLVLPDYTDITAPFPIETHCKLDRPVIDLTTRKHLAEISRFAISKEFKKRRGESRTILGIAEQTKSFLEANERRTLPHISVGLISGILRIARENEITCLYAVMEPALLRLLRRFGIYFVPIGKDTEYHGIRTPCIENVENLLTSIKDTARPIWALITDNGELA